MKAAQVFNLGIAGVDIMEGPDGPTLLEVNSSPGFEGIEKATRQNVAGLIMKHLHHEARKRQAATRRRRAVARKVAKKRKK
jgi:ribosomal protein S6--L-glutamate ligase